MGADPRRHRADAERDRGDGDGPRRSSARSSARSGVDVLGRVIKAGIAAEIVASVGIGLALLLVFRTQDFSILTHTLGAEALSGGSVGAGMLAALAVGGWVFIGFDACVGASEETRGAARHVPRAIWIALLSVGGARDPERVRGHARAPRPGRRRRRRATSTRSRTSVVSSFGSWSAKPFAAVVLAAFLACGMAAQALTARTIYSIARDGVLPGSRFLRRVDRRQAPIGAIVVDHGRRLPRPAARPALGGRRQPDRVRHGGDLRRVPARRARRADRARCAGRWMPAGRVRLGPRRCRRQRARGGLARVRDASTSPGRGRRSPRRARPATRSGRPRSCSP